MRILPILALILSLLAPTLPAAQTVAPAASEPAAPDAAEAARILADALQDPEARAALIAQLQAAGDTAAAPEEPAAESFDAALARVVADRTRAVAEGLSDGATDVIATVSDWDALAAQAAAVDWSGITDAATAVGAVIAATAGLFYLLRRLTRPLRARIAGRAAPRSLAGKLAGLAAIAFFDLALILLAWGAGYAVALWGVGAATQMDLRQSLFLNAFLVVEVGRLILRLCLGAGRPELRLLPIGDTAANEAYAHLARILTVLGYGMLVAVPVARSALGADAAGWIALGVALAAAAMAIRLVLRNRLKVRGALETRAHRRGVDGVVGGALGILAQVWHLLAIAYVFGLFVVWTARPADSLGFMVAATLQSVAAVAVGTIAMVAIGRRITRGVRLNADIGRRLPMLEERLNALVPNALSVLRLLLFAAVIGVILEVWGLFAVSEWLATDTGGRLVQGLISASFILVACGVIWIGVSSWIEYKVTPPDGRTVRPREATLLTLLRNAFTVVMVVMATMLTLSALGLNIAPLLAGAGVIGLAIGFGAQRLVQDIITGVFIQFENAMNTGDVVAAGSVTGTVEKLTIRSVGLRDTSGTFHVVPFSSVTTVANFTKGYAFHLAEFAFAYSDDPVEAKKIMRSAFDELREGEQRAKVLGDFDMQGVVAFSETAYTIRARIRTTAGGQWAVARAYSEILMRRLSEAKIGLPFQSAAAAPPVADPEPAPRLILPDTADDPAADPRQQVKLSR